MSFVVVVLHNTVVIMDQYFYMVVVFIRMLLMHCIKKDKWVQTELTAGPYFCIQCTNWTYCRTILLYTMYKLNLLEDNISVYNVQTELTAGPYFCIRFMVLYFLDFYSKLFFFYVYNGRLCFTFDANPRNKCVHIPVVWIVNFYKRKRHFN